MLSKSSHNRSKLRQLIISFGLCHLHIECTRCVRSSGRPIGRCIAIVHQCVNDARGYGTLPPKKRERGSQANFRAEFVGRGNVTSMAKGKTKKKGFRCSCPCGCGSRNSDVLCKYRASVAFYTPSFMTLLVLRGCDPRDLIARANERKSHWSRKFYFTFFSLQPLITKRLYFLRQLDVIVDNFFYSEYYLKLIRFCETKFLCSKKKKKIRKKLSLIFLFYLLLCTGNIN